MASRAQEFGIDVALKRKVCLALCTVLLMSRQSDPSGAGRLGVAGHRHAASTRDGDACM